MQVKKNTLLLLACLVWTAAGVNILRIGLLAYATQVSLPHILLSLLVFFLFQVFVFGRLVGKHTRRILGYWEDRQFFLRFFDKKSFLLMAGMMSLGMFLRVSGLAPDPFLAVFYSGLGAALLLAGCQGEAAPAVSYDLDQVPAYAGEPYVVINDNQPFFGEEEYTTEAFETYSALDGLGRCGTAYACVGEELMPAGERESISSVKPSGWINVEYGGQYLYNRCHLIGFQLTGENANERNLITGTRYMNVEGMLPFENLVADYVKETSNHVLYRVTPLYEGDNLVASGVLMEAGSVEDEREGICFNVYVYNVQPGIGIDYATGASWAEGEQGEIQSSPTPAGTAYVLNTNTKKFHLPTCASVEDMKPENRTDYTGSREALLDEGYSPCGQCKP